MNQISRRDFLLFMLSSSILLIMCLMQSVPASSDALLEISVSFVESDPFAPGDSFHLIVEIRNREAQGRVDVLVNYTLLDSDGGVVLFNSKTVAVETKASFAEEFNLPVYIAEGTYFLRANVSSLNGSQWSEASRSFSVVVISEAEQRIIEYILIIGLVSMGGGLFYEHRRVTKLKVSGRDLKRFIGGQKRE